MAVSSTCPRGHVIPNIHVFCPDPGCPELLVLSNVPRLDGRLRVGFPIAATVVSCIGGLVLFRETESLLSAYAYIIFILINLYAMVYSRGGALFLVSAAAITATVSWALSSTLISDQPPVTQLYIALSLWGVAILYSVLVGYRFSIPSFRTRATYFLAMISLVMGMWWVVALALRSGVDYTVLLYVVVLLCAVVPLVLISASIGFSTVDAIAAQFAAFFTYLSIVHLVIGMVDFGFSMIAVRMLGTGDGGTFSDPVWLATVFDLKSAASAILAALGLIFLLSRSVTLVAREFTSTNHTFLMSNIAASISHVETGGDPLGKLSEQIALIAQRITRAAYLMGVFTALAFAKFLYLLIDVLRRMTAAIWQVAQRFVAPVVGFSTVAILLMTILRDTLEYSRGDLVSITPLALWGGLFCAAGTGLSILTLSLLLAPNAKDAHVSLNGAPALVVIGGIFWALFTISSIALWPIWYAARNIGVDVPSLSFGPELLINLVAVTAALIAFVLVALVSDIGTKRDSRLRPQVIIVGFSVVLLSGVFSGLFLGSSALTRWAQFIAG